MSFETSVEFGDGKVFVEMPEEAADQMMITILKGYRDLLQESMDYEAEQYMMNGYMQDYQVNNVKENLLYLFGINKVLDYLGEADAE